MGTPHLGLWLTPGAVAPSSPELSSGAVLLGRKLLGSSNVCPCPEESCKEKGFSELPGIF